MGAFYDRTTDSKVVDNYLRNANAYIKELDSDISCHSYKSELLYSFSVELFRHIKVCTLLGNREGVLSFTQGYEVREWFLELYLRVPFFNLEQALRLLEAYYSQVILPALHVQQAGVNHHEASGGFNEVLDTSSINTALLEVLDTLFLEFAPKMILSEAVRVLYIFARAGYTSSVFLDRFAVRYSSYLRQSPQSLLDSPKMLVKLFWAVCRSQDFQNQEILLKMLEMQLLKNNILPTLNYSNFSTIVAGLSGKAMGSAETWSIIKRLYLAKFPGIRQRLKPRALAYRQLFLVLYNFVVSNPRTHYDSEVRDHVRASLGYLRRFVEYAVDTNKPSPEDKESAVKGVVLLLGLLYDPQVSLTPEELVHVREVAACLTRL